MPNFDGTGPLGTGPTGWGCGPCGLGLGPRRGRGFGFRRGFGNFSFGQNQPWTVKDQKQYLADYQKALEQELDQVKQAQKDLKQE